MNPRACPRRILVAVLLVGLCYGCRPPEPPAAVLTIDGPSASMRPPNFDICDGGEAVEASGLDSEVVKALSKVDWEPDQWAAVFALYVEPADGSDPTQRPPVLGAYRIADGALRFTPRFPLSRGVHYRAVLHADHVPARKKDRKQW